MSDEKSVYRRIKNRSLSSEQDRVALIEECRLFVKERGRAKANGARLYSNRTTWEHSSALMQVAFPNGPPTAPCKVVIINGTERASASFRLNGAPVNPTSRIEKEGRNNAR